MHACSSLQLSTTALSASPSRNTKINIESDIFLRVRGRLTVPVSAALVVACRRPRVPQAAPAPRQAAKRVCSAEPPSR